MILCVLIVGSTCVGAFANTSSASSTFSLPNIEDVLYYDASTDIRPAYDACQGSAYVACTDPRVIAVEVNGQKVNSNYIYVDASRYEVSKNPYLDLAVTFYFRGGSISTTVSINLFSYMAHDIVPID